MGQSNNAAQQNQAANQQVKDNTAQAQQALQQYLAANPSILAGAPKSIAPPTQISGVQQGQNFGGANMPRVAPSQPPQIGQPLPGGPPQRPPVQLPPGLLGLLGRPSG